METDISITLIKNDETVDRVKEKDSIIIQIKNGKLKLKNATLWLGGSLVTELGDFPAKAKREAVLSVGDYIGDAIISLKAGKDGGTAAMKRIIIEPETMSIEEFNVLVKDRIPHLMEVAGVENVLDLIPRGADIKQESKTVDYHVERLLNRYSKNLIDLTLEILNLMTYGSEKIQKMFRERIKGTVKWNKTMQMRMQKGLNYSTTHICEYSRRTYVTPTNLLLFNFHKVILHDANHLLARYQQRESEKLMWRRIYKIGGDDYDADVMMYLNRLRRATKMHNALLTEYRYQELADKVKTLGKSELQLIRDAELEARQAKNSSYTPLVRLYQDYLQNYRPEYVKSIVVDAKSMEEVYQLWVLFELANALGLKSVSHSMREYKNRDGTSYMQFQNLESILSPWTEAREGNNLFLDDEEVKIDRSLIGPNIYLMNEDMKVYIHTMYDEKGQGLSRKNKYMVLGYMEDFNIRQGIVFYPGKKIQFNYDRPRKGGRRRILVEAPLIPNFTNDKKSVEGIEEYIQFIINAMSNVNDRLKARENPAELVDEYVKEIGEKAEKMTA